MRSRFKIDAPRREYKKTPQRDVDHVPERNHVATQCTTAIFAARSDWRNRDNCPSPPHVAVERLFCKLLFEELRAVGMWSTLSQITPVSGHHLEKAHMCIYLQV